jgi:hypothetical protein
MKNSRLLSKPYHDPADEPAAEPIDPMFFDFDFGEPLSKEQLKGTRQGLASSLHEADAET